MDKHRTPAAGIDTSGKGNTTPHRRERNGHSTALSPSPQPLSHPGRGASGPPSHTHEAKRFAALQSGGLGVANPRKHSFCALFLRLRRKKRAQKGARGCAPVGNMRELHAYGAIRRPSHVETFSRKRTPLGIVAAVCNRWICPLVTFFPRLQTTLLVGEGHDINRNYSG